MLRRLFDLVDDPHEQRNLYGEPETVGLTGRWEKRTGERGVP